ncbi:hypothetical protein [Sphingopyxis fribergensis]
MDWFTLGFLVPAGALLAAIWVTIMAFARKESLSGRDKRNLAINWATVPALYVILNVMTDLGKI